MSENLWSSVDRYISELFIPHEPALDGALEASVAAGMPAIAVSPAEGKLLHLYARLMGARNILEIGTLGGYSTIWLARALPPYGRLVTLELEPKHAHVAAANLECAGLSGLVDIRVGRALDILPQLQREGGPPFDLIFIDADKQSNAEYFEWALTLSRKGSLIIVDNVVRGGAVADPDTTDPMVLGVRRFNEALAKETRVSATEIQTVGSKGYDGFAFILVDSVVGSHQSN